MISGVKADGTTETSAPAIFLFATEDGTIVGWNPGVNPKGFNRHSLAQSPRVIRASCSRARKPGEAVMQPEPFDHSMMSC